MSSILKGHYNPPPLPQTTINICLSQSYEMFPPSCFTSTRMLKNYLFLFGIINVLLNLFRKLFSLCVFELVKSCYQVLY